MTRRHTTTVIGATQSVRSKDGTTISYLSIGGGPSVLVIPGVLSMAADYAAFARSLAEHFTVHTIERRGRGESGLQGDDYNTALTKIAVYEPGVSIDGSMPIDWMPGYEKKLAEKKDSDALAECAIGVGPEHLRKTPHWLMKLGLLLFISSHERQQMLGLLHENLREWREIARLDSSYENYREIAAGVLLMYGGKSDSKAVTLAMERLAAILPHSETKEFPKLDHFGIERTAPREVAKAVSVYFLKE
jgi:pimeloyl-ACP methyl ester carboxylesterase